jgi:membrane-bound lytic murein transglycosylase D
MNEDKTYIGVRSPYSVLVEVIKGQARESVKRFTGTFLIGRSSECDIQLHENCVSRKHLKVTFDGKQWMLQDLESANGTFMNGLRIQHLPLPDRTEIELGQGGAVLSLTIERPVLPKAEEPPAVKTGFTSETQIIQHYLDTSRTEKVGVQTMMFRRAFERVQKKKSRKYLIIIGTALILLAVSGVFIIYQKNKISALTKTAEEIFYSMKSIELQIGKLEDIMLLQAKPKQLAELQEKRGKLKDMEKEYDKLVKELGIYAKMSEEDRIIVRTARTLGECELNVPKEFTREVKNYMRKWKSSDRLKESLGRARTKGYAFVVKQVMARYELQPHFFFLALQESGFRDDAVGPKTRYGCAKGIWQLIPNTAKQYGLKIGPLFEESVYDRKDERFDFEKATKAAAAYLRDISNTEAQASGLLVMASYNWGENNTRRIIRQMPQNPRERNFWRLLSMKTIPQETYDYVFYIFSAATICENPRLFGFDVECPLATQSR